MQITAPVKTPEYFNCSKAFWYSYEYSGIEPGVIVKIIDPSQVVTLLNELVKITAISILFLENLYFILPSTIAFLNFFCNS